MVLLLTFALVAGVVTVLSPCILPVLPVVLASSLGSSRLRPLGVVVGLVVSFAFFTLALTTLVSLLRISPDALRLGGAAVIGLFGLVLLVPGLRYGFEAASGRLAELGGRGSDGGGFASGVLVGASLGIVWAPCAGPILAAVTTVVATNSISPEAVAVTIAYSIGSGIPMLAIAYGGRRVVSRVRLLNQHTETLQRAFAVVMVAFALSFFLGFDRTVQAALVQSVPANYTNGLTSIENQPGVRQALNALRQGDEESRGAVMGEAPALLAAPPESSAMEVAPTPTPAGAAAPAIRQQAVNLPDLGMAPELKGIVGWINSDPTSLSALRGKVVIVDFWTYSCINCIRTLPYMNDWYAKYRDQGLEILGIHTPEFEFEKSQSNVAGAVKQYGIEYPVAFDNSYATWNAYNNQYWPAKYVVDARGHVRFVHFGEGKYEETEAVIQALLRETGASTMADNSQLESYALTRGSTPETYFGADRQGNLASPEKYVVGRPNLFTAPAQLSRDQFALQGDWNVQKEYAEAGAGAKLQLQFYANNVYIVLIPGPAGEEVDVMLDGKSIPPEHSGMDVHSGHLSAHEARLYHLVDLKGMPGEHQLTLQFTKGGAQAYTFTFG